MPSPVAPQPKVVALILNYRTWASTLECLESVYASDYPNFDVVVVENGSNDDSLEKILAWAKGELPPQTPPSSPIFGSVGRLNFPLNYQLVDERGTVLQQNSGGSDPALTLVKLEKNRGCYGGFNPGIRWCQSQEDFQYLWLLPNDTAVRKDCLGLQVGRAEKNGWGICGAKSEFYDQPGRTQALGGRFNPFTSRNRNIEAEAGLDRIDYVYGNAMLLTRACVELGPLPEEYFLYFEDVDFCHGVRAAGMRLGVATEAVVYHKGGISSDKMEKEYYFARNILLFVWKNMPWVLPISLWHVLVHRFAMKVFRGEARNLGPLLQGVGHFFLGKRGKGP